MARTRGFDVDEALDAALEVFWVRGFEASSMPVLCQAMGVQPGSAYAAFGSKRDLFRAALQRYATTVSADAVLRLTSSPSGLDGLRNYFDHLVEAMVDGRRRWGCLITNSLVEFAERDPEFAGVFSLHLANLETAFEAALAHARSAGEVRGGAGSAQAKLLVAVVQGMNVLAKAGPGHADLQSIADAALAGLALRPTSTSEPEASSSAAF